MNNFSNILVSLFKTCTMKLPIDTSRAFQIYQKSLLASEHANIFQTSFFSSQKLQNVILVGKKLTHVGLKVQILHTGILSLIRTKDNLLIQNVYLSMGAPGDSLIYVAIIKG